MRDMALDNIDFGKYLNLPELCHYDTDNCGYKAREGFETVGESARLRIISNRLIGRPINPELLQQYCATCERYSSKLVGNGS